VIIKPASACLATLGACVRDAAPIFTLF